MNKTLPFSISIVIPAYNEERHLKACLDSVKAQSVKPTEVIVVDNASADGTAKIAKNYPFVRLLHEKRRGVAYARDKGFNAASSKIIGRIDADTVLPQDWVYKIKKFYQDMEHSQEALTGGGYFYNIRTPRFNGWVQSQLAYRTNRFITGYYILWGSNMALPKALWERVKGEVCHQNDFHEDMDLAIHLHRLGYKVAYDAQMRVGVYLKRVWENRSEQKAHVHKWPNTLRAHGYRGWWMGSIGNFLILYILQPYVFIADIAGRLMGRRLKYNRRTG